VIAFAGFGLVVAYLFNRIIERGHRGKGSTKGNER